MASVSWMGCNAASVELEPSKADISSLKKCDNKVILNFTAWGFNFTTIIMVKLLYSQYPGWLLLCCTSIEPLWHIQ
jgi:hypothetical protein